MCYKLLRPPTSSSDGYFPGRIGPIFRDCIGRIYIQNDRIILEWHTGNYDSHGTMSSETIAKFVEFLKDYEFSELEVEPEDMLRLVAAGENGTLLELPK